MPSLARWANFLSTSYWVTGPTHATCLLGEPDHSVCSTALSTSHAVCSTALTTAHAVCSTQLTTAHATCLLGAPSHATC